MNSLHILTAAGVLAAACTAQIDNLRITEVAPASDQAEVTNTGPAFVTPVDYPFCHRSTYTSVIPAGTSFAAGEAKVFTVTNLDDNDSDLWLYRARPFGVAANLVHGVKFGPAASVGRSGVASSVGLWPSVTAFAPAPGAGQTLAYDGIGNGPSDWYVDDSPSLGAADPVATGTVPTGLAVLSGTDDFEAVPLGDTARALTGWVIVDSGTAAGDFDMHVIGDVAGASTPAPVAGSTKWLRVRDQDASAAQNRFYSGFLDTQGTALSYDMTFYVNPLELPPAAAANKPRVTVQHRLFAGGVTNAWGIELDASGASLVVLSDGGPVSSQALGALTIGTWSEIVLSIDFAGGVASATLDGGAAVSAAIAPAATVDATQLRYCYRGEGVENVATLLFDEISFAFGTAAACAFRNGTGANPADYTCGNAPVLGAQWQGDVATVPTTAGVFLLLGLGGPLPPFPFAGAGELLVAPPIQVLPASAMGGGSATFLLNIPFVTSASGFVLSTQAIRIDGAQLQLVNAQDLVLGR
ncbi:MAG: hypothetical protein AAF628_25350 [Planctomycetota bacterium]